VNASCLAILRLLSPEKEFARSKRSYVPVAGKGLKEQYETRFYTPLGLGVATSSVKDFSEAWLRETKRLASEFQVPAKWPLYSSYDLKTAIGLKAAIPFYDQLVQSTQKFVDSIFVSYVVLPPNNIPTMKVGGQQCPEEDVPTQEFLRKLGPMFSYITAWAYFGRPRQNCDVCVDTFSSKWTPAWHDLTKVENLKVFPHGDECNALIHAADVFAFLTDAKLYNQFKRLLPNEIQSVWKDYKFETEVRFLDDKISSKYTWKSQDTIDTTPHLARPMIFLLVDQIEKLALSQPTSDSLEEQPKFREMLRKMEPWAAAVTHALKIGGAVQSYGELLIRKE